MIQNYDLNKKYSIGIFAYTYSIFIQWFRLTKELCIMYINATKKYILNLLPIGTERKTLKINL